MVAVVREALTNVGRHAEAQRAEVVVSADSQAVDVEVLDDGRGVSKEITLSGLANLRKRAEVLGGSFEITGRSGPGTRLHWTVPLGPIGQ